MPSPVIDYRRIYARNSLSDRTTGLFLIKEENRKRAAERAAKEREQRLVRNVRTELGHYLLT